MFNGNNSATTEKPRIIAVGITQYAEKRNGGTMRTMLYATGNNTDMKIIAKPKHKTVELALQCRGQKIIITITVYTTSNMSA